MATRPAPPVPGGRSRDGRSSGSVPPIPRQKPRVGQYIIEKTLGTGSFGKVKLATHSITGHQVALKHINRSKITTPDMNARVQREIQYLKVLRHPHIIKLYEVIMTAQEVIMVMEYAGEELFNYIVAKGKGGMHEDEARRFFQQIMGALEYCHRHHIVHRDLKPENLFLDSRQNIKIGDFGLSNLMTDGDFLKTSCGSPNYAAPEVISGKLYSGPEIDVWSAGVILYVLLCGKLPFDDDHIPSLFKKIDSGQYQIPSHMSEDARHLLKRMLTVDPLKRATIAEIRTTAFFQHNLPRYLQPLPEVERYPTLPMDDLSTLLLINEGQADPRKVAEDKGMLYTDDLGVIDPEIVEELLEKITTYSEAMVWDALQKEGDNQVKVAYQLVRDHRRILKDSLYGYEDEDESVMEEFLASSPPAFDEGITQPASLANNVSTAIDDLDWEEADGEIQDIPNAHFDVLDSSLPGYITPFSETSNTVTGTPTAGRSPGPHGSAESQEAAERAARALLASGAHHHYEKPMAKPKWHFGIRSRSPPMEVMLEIYKTLSVLGMEWRTKEGIDLPEIGPPAPEGYPEDITAALEQWASYHGGEVPEMSRKAPGKKELAAQEKAAQGLYLVETRARYGDFMVRMDLQLYKVDQVNYLVDFRNIGYYNAMEKGGLASAETAASATAETQPKTNGGKMETPGLIGGVSGPFQFLEMACQLIAELASG